METYFLDVIRGKRKAPLLIPLLQILSVFYRGVLALRNKAYDWGILSSQRVAVPVVSIGNIVVGGTGKTPVTEMLSLALQEKCNLAILTRGFRSEMEKRGQMGQIRQGNAALECGDEPSLLVQKTKAAVWVGSDRVSSARAAIAEGAECLLLDDGMQHRRIARDFEIVVIDAQDPLSQGRFLPRGLLRDAPHRLKNADLILLTHCKDVAQFDAAHRQIAPYTQAPCVGVRVCVLNAEELPGKVGVFCGIGTPERFLQTVRDLNREIVDTFLLKDHGMPSEDALLCFAKECREKGAVALLCTEKDAVKWPRFSSHLGLPVIPVIMQLECVVGKEHFEKMVQKIRDKVGK